MVGYRPASVAVSEKLPYVRHVTYTADRGTYRRPGCVQHRALGKPQPEGVEASLPNCKWACVVNGDPSSHCRCGQRNGQKYGSTSSESHDAAASMRGSEMVLSSR